MINLGDVVLAVAVPILWGLLSAWAFDKLKRRRSARLPNNSNDGEPTE